VIGNRKSKITLKISLRARIRAFHSTSPNLKSYDLRILALLLLTNCLFGAKQHSLTIAFYRNYLFKMFTCSLHKKLDTEGQLHKQCNSQVKWWNDDVGFVLDQHS
jgi:hypothetical protein